MAGYEKNSGACYTGVPSAPFAPYAPQICFQPAFVPSAAVNNTSFSNDALSVMPNYSSTGQVLFPQETSPWGYVSSNPKIVNVMAWEDVQKFMYATGQKQTFDDFVTWGALGRNMYLVHYKNQTMVAAPLNVEYFNKEPNCSNCLKSLWQCDRYKNQMQSQPNNSEEQGAATIMYNVCKTCSECFLYDCILPSGVLIPIMIKINPTCLLVVKSALEKCILECGASHSITPMANRGTNGDYPLFYDWSQPPENQNNNTV